MALSATRERRPSRRRLGRSERRRRRAPPADGRRQSRSSDLDRGGARAQPEWPPAKIDRGKDDAVVAALRRVHRDIAAFRPRGFGPPVHGAAVASRVFLLGQAPGPHEARFGRPFAWTAGRTLFKWLERATGADEETLRARIYIAAVVRCFPGKTGAGGDRVPTPEECARWRHFIAREVEILRPRLVLPVGRLAIQEVLGHMEPIAAVVGRALRTQFHGVDVDVIPLPHPSGASTWFKMEPGRTLLDDALRLVAAHPEVERTFRRGRR